MPESALDTSPPLVLISRVAALAPVLEGSNTAFTVQVCVLVKCVPVGQLFSVIWN